MLLQSESSQQGVPFCCLWAGKNLLVSCTDTLALVCALYRLLWEMGPSSLPKPSGQNLWDFRLGAGAAPVCVDPTPLESPSTRSGLQEHSEAPWSRRLQAHLPQGSDTGSWWESKR